VGVVVLLVRAAAGELDPVLVAVAVELGVDELGAVVRVDALQAERQGLADLVEGALHAALALAQDGARFGPGGLDVDDVQGVGELASGRGAAMGDEIELGEAGDGDIPVIGLQGNVVLEEGAGLGAAVAPGLEVALVRRQAPIDLPGTDPAELGLGRGGEVEMAPRPRQPERQQRLEADRPRVARRRPDLRQRLDHPRGIRESAAPRPAPGLPGRRPVEQPDRVLAVVLRHATELIQDPLLLLAPRAPIAGMDRPQVLPLRFRTHDVHLLRPRADEGYIPKWRDDRRSVTF
jgi:hypothetical protein